MAFALESFAFCFWLKNVGMAIAARIPMISMTTSSSIRVNPFSLAIRSRSFNSIWTSLPKSIAARAPCHWESGYPGGSPAGSEIALRAPLALRPHLAMGLPFHRGPGVFGYTRSSAQERPSPLLETANLADRMTGQSLFHPKRRGRARRPALLGDALANWY